MSRESRYEVQEVYCLLMSRSGDLDSLLCMGPPTKTRDQRFQLSRSKSIQIVLASNECEQLKRLRDV